MARLLRIILIAAAVLPVSATAYADMQKLAEVSWWAAYGGLDTDGKFKCAMVTALPDGRDGKFVIEHWRGVDRLLLRFVKPSWAVESGSQKNVNVRFGYGRIWNLAATGSGNEVRGEISLQDAPAFLSGFQSAGRIDVAFIGGTEPPWELATGGGGIVENDFRKCIRMTVPAKSMPATQP